MKRIDSIASLIFSIAQFLIYSILAVYSLSGWWYVLNSTTDKPDEDSHKAWLFGIKIFLIFGFFIPLIVIFSAYWFDLDGYKIGANSVPYVILFLFTCFIGFMVRVFKKED